MVNLMECRRRGFIGCLLYWASDRAGDDSLRWLCQLDHRFIFAALLLGMISTKSGRRSASGIIKCRIFLFGSFSD
jgi:hypothetical protein